MSVPLSLSYWLGEVRHGTIVDGSGLGAADLIRSLMSLGVTVWIWVGFSPYLGRWRPLLSITNDGQTQVGSEGGHPAARPPFGALGETVWIPDIDAWLQRPGDGGQYFYDLGWMKMPLGTVAPPTYEQHLYLLGQSERQKNLSHRDVVHRPPTRAEWIAAGVSMWS